MNTKIKLFNWLFLLTLFFTFSSCEKDLYDEAIQQKRELTIKKISLNELSKTDNAKLFKTVDLISLKKKDEHSKIVYDSKNKFYFDDANGKEIESADGYKSFTFQIYTSDSLAKVENVLFTEKINGEYDAYRVKYDFTEKELKTLSKEQLSKLKVEYTYITSSKPNKTSKASYNCLEISEWSSYPTDQGDLTGDFGYDGEWVTLAVVCGKTNTEIQTGTDDSISNSGWGTGTFDNTGSGSTNGSTTSGGVYTSPVVTPGVQFINGLNFDTKDNISWLSNDAQKIVFDYLTANSFNDTSKARAKYVLDHFNLFWITEQPTGTDVTIFNYFSQNSFSSESGDFVNQMINYCIANTLNSDSKTTELFFKALRATNNFQDNLTESFVQDNISYFSQDVQNQILIDPLLAVQIAQEYLIQRAVKKHLHPNWSEARIYYSILWDLRHMTLDAFGLIPVIGEVADLANGTLYTLEGDKVNAAFSFASAVPVYGWAAVGVKYAVKIKTVATIGTKVQLTWKVLLDGTIYFGSNSTCRAQLRRVLGLAVGNLNQAHHIIPLNLQTNLIVQKAAKSGNAFHLNEALNGIPLSTAVHNGSHANYDGLILQKLESFRIANPNATPNQCYDQVTYIIDKIRIAISNSPTTPINQLIF